MLFDLYFFCLMNCRVAVVLYACLEIILLLRTPQIRDALIQSFHIRAVFKCTSIRIKKLVNNLVLSNQEDV